MTELSDNPTTSQPDVEPDSVHSLERKLAESLRFLAALTDNVPVRLAYFDLQGRLQFVNKVLCDRFGSTRERMLGRTLAEISGSDQESPVAHRLKLAATGQTQRFEYADTVDGETRHILTQFIPDVGADGAITGVFGVGVDITHLKNVERSLRDLTDVFDHTTDYVAQADSKGDVLYINPAGRRLLGYMSETPLPGLAAHDCFSSETNRRWESEILPQAARHGVWVGETSLRLPGG